MPPPKLPVALHSRAFQLRKKLLQRASLEELLNCHNEHQVFLAETTPLINARHLSFSDRFAWKFLREINILSLDFAEISSEPEEKQSPPGRGLFVNLPQVVEKVRGIWFPEMGGPTSVVWLKRFSVRKLAHYSHQLDEIAFSLIFDFIDVPAEIVSYLAYHELLHRQLGAERKNGRRYSHTGAFKHQEHLFPNWRDMDRQISDYILRSV